MAEATFRHGDPHMIDYTPASGNIAAGQVVLYGNTTGLTCLVCHTSILNTRKGAMAAGGGVYEVTNLNNAANGAKVWWDDSVNKVTTVSTNNALFGFIASQGGAGANSACYALHKPYV
jgi:predicted RecA/RadA family phage recombinase